MVELTLIYPRKLLSHWKSGNLHKVWSLEHRHLFDAPDLEYLANQHENGYHFGEWYTAVYFAQRGFDVLVEKYLAHKTHQRKAKVLRSVLKKDGVGLLENCIEGRGEGPDLFVFDPKQPGFYFFVEVKREDTLKASQQRDIERIQERICPVIIVRLQPGN